MRNAYLTVKGYGEHEIVIQKSRFIAYVDRAETEEEAQAFIQKIKQNEPVKKISRNSMDGIGTPHRVLPDQNGRFRNQSQT